MSHQIEIKATDGSESVCLSVRQRDLVRGPRTLRCLARAGLRDRDQLGALLTRLVEVEIDGERMAGRISGLVRGERADRSDRYRVEVSLQIAPWSA